MIVVRVGQRERVHRHQVVTQIVDSNIEGVARRWFDGQKLEYPCAVVDARWRDVMDSTRETPRFHQTGGRREGLFDQ